MPNISRKLSRFLAFSLAVIMMVSMVPSTVFASNDPLSDSTGTGWSNVGVNDTGSGDPNDVIASDGYLDSGAIDSSELPPKDDVDEGVAAIERWNQQVIEYQEWAESLSRSGSPQTRAAGPVITIVGQIPIVGAIEWFSGVPTNPFTMARAVPHIQANGIDAFCFEFNNMAPSGDYIVGGVYDDAPVLQILANYHANPGNPQYVAAQVAIWQYVSKGHIKLSEVDFNGNVSPAVAQAIFEGTESYSAKVYTLLTGGAQDVIYFTDEVVKDLYSLKIIKKNEDGSKTLPGAIFSVTGPNGFKKSGLSTNSAGEILIGITEAGTYTVTETSPPLGYLPADPNFKTVTVAETNTPDNPAVVEFRNAEELLSPDTPGVGESFGQVTVIKKDAEGKPLTNSIFRIDILFSNGSKGGTSRFQVVDGANTYTYSHPAGNTGRARVTVTEVKAPDGYVIDDTPQSLWITPTYTTYNITTRVK